jgi:hypothetical protein
MCGGIADSREHVFKASDLRRIFDRDGHSFTNLPFHFKAGAHGRIPGPNSETMKYPEIICANCNNNRSRPYDIAYSNLSDWFHNNRRISDDQIIDSKKCLVVN